MARVVSYLEEVVTPFRHFLPTNRARAQTVDDGYIESADEVVQLVEAREFLAPYSARRFKELRCPICRTFGCEGC